MWFCLCHTENVFVSLWQKFWHLLFLRSPFVLAFEGFEGSHSSCQWIVALSGSSSCLVHPAIMHVLLDTYTAGTANTVNLCITILVQVLTQQGDKLYPGLLGCAIIGDWQIIALA